ncbi:adenylate/guanylate cyclase domain-containing protein [Mycolicibacterium cyprinidarum]|uniref:Adenylate/guanylate cyclase domain-containing protein n=1 Tax=Mycolicibacterium cyprinidarum TaxID=2860311 RepID=A0ABQ4VDJ8_9MYCO|nr:adenylate/guanylate cyclase domain-containing protein [Mycolicibacterium sp. NGTWSNA01]GJF16473.1 adenylate/guanylate cyclase domain-containing protein [Mycolicibacterium sp. NGTWS0302]
MITRLHKSSSTAHEPAYPVELPRYLGKVLSRMSIQSKFMLMLLAISILSVAVVGYIGFESGRTSLRAAAFDRLTELRESQSRQITAEISEMKNSIILFARTNNAATAMSAYTAGFNELNRPGAPSTDPAQDQALVDYYTNVFAPEDEAKTGTQLDVPALLPTSAAQRYLQVHYTIPFKDSPQRIKVDDAGDNSEWSTANARFNGFFRTAVERFEFEDALLIDTDGNVVYTANKGIDLGTNVVNGPFRGGDLTRAFNNAMQSNALNYVEVTDFSNYQPALGPTAWMVSPVGPADKVTGVLALQLPMSKINRLMTVDRNWELAGMGSTGEMFLVGADELMRSDSRLFLEDPDAFRSEVVAAGTPPAVADTAIHQGTTVLIQPAGTEATRLANQGKTGTLIADDYLGRKTLQAYAPILDSELGWNIVAKIDVREAFAPVAQFTRTLVLSTTAIIFIVCLVAMLLARRFVRPIKRLEAGSRQITSGDYGAVLPLRSLDEFGDLTVAFNEMSRNLALHQQLLVEERAENNRLLLSLMPESVVQRYREGEENIALDHSDVSVIFADVAGMDELAVRLSPEESLTIVNTLVQQFDAAAESLGIEQIRTQHNGYLASCGLNQPRLDNVRRTVDFAIEMAHIVDRFNAESGYKLRLRAGIDTGTVGSGLIGGSSIDYDMWGAAVNIAYQVRNGSSQPGIYVSPRVYDVVRDLHDFSPAGVISHDGTDEQIYRLTESS